MTHRSLIVALVTAATAIPCALAQDAAKPTDRGQPTEHAMPAMPPEMMERMQACMEAGQPGEMHERLARSAGTWDGKIKHWFMPGTEPVQSTCITTLTPVFDGRYLKCEVVGEMPEMGRFEGFGLYGFNNVTEEFESTWIDNMSTGIMTGKGELSPDGKTLTWTCTFADPETKQLTRLREVERHIDDNTMTLEMFGPDLEGNEFKMMEIRYKRRTPKAAANVPAGE